MDDYGKLPLLLARIASLEQQVKGDRVLIEELRRQVRMATRASEIIRAADGTGPMPAVPAPRSHAKAKPPRDRSHLRVVKGAAFAAGLAGVARWLWGSTARRVATVALGTTLAGGTVLLPSVQSVINPPQQHIPPRAQSPAATSPGAPPPRRRHTAGPVAHHASPPPSHLQPSPSPSDDGWTPKPHPSPSPPVPLPSPSLPSPGLTGCIHHPHPGCPTPPADLPLPSLLDGRVVSAREWLIKTQRLRLHQLATAA